MSFTRRRSTVGGAVGDWSLGFRDDVRQAILETVDPDNPANKFGHVVITPGRVDPAAIDPLTVARFTGRLIERSDDGYGISGDGLEAWLGDADDTGKLKTSATNASDSFEDWWTFWETNDYLNGLTLGDIDTIAGPFKVVTAKGLNTVRPLADQLCEKADAEWRVNPDGTIDAGTVTSLYGTTPVAVLTRDPGGGNLNLPGLPVTSWGYTAHQEEYFSGTYVPYADDTAFEPSTVTPASKRLDGSAVVRERVIDGNDNADDATSAGELADKKQAQMGTRVLLAPTVDVWDAGQYIQPGSRLYVFDPRLGLYDTSTQVAYRGQLIFPKVLRVNAITQPFRDGMGAYYRAPDATGTYTDLTQWVVPETGDASLEVGALRRRFLNTKRRGEAA